MASSNNPSTARKAVIDAATSLYDLTSGYAAPRLETGSKRSMLAGTAASLIGLSLDKLEASGSAKGHYVNDGDSATRQTNTQHFSDKLISKLINNAIPASERGEIDMKMEDKFRSEKPGLSIRTITRNFKNLSYKMDLLFSIQYGVVHFFSWSTPTLTLFGLVLYSWACIDPYMFLVYPLWGILVFLLVPNYLHRHPVGTPEILQVRGRGSSMFGFLKEDKEWKLEQQKLEERRLKFEQELFSDVYGMTNPDSGIFSDTESEFDDSSLTTAAIAEVVKASGGIENEDNTKEPFVTSLVAASFLKHEDTSSTSSDEEKQSKSSKVSKKVKLLINMRDLQNLTTDILNAMESYEKFVYEAASFVDEKKSTRLFYHVLSLVIVLFVFGPYIPWKAIFILGAWFGLLSVHPQRKSFFKMISNQATSRYDPSELYESPGLYEETSGEDETQDDMNTPISGSSDREDSKKAATTPPKLPPRPDSTPPALPPRDVKQIPPNSSPPDYESVVRSGKSERKTEVNTSIVIDEDIQYREAEIFEVEQQGLTHYHYKPFCISNHIFSSSSATRTQKKRPKGVPVIDMVQPPSGWQYDPKYKWEVDLNPRDWCVERGVIQEMEIHEGEDEGWAYDIDNEYRRRRLTRTCVLTARPPRKIK